MTMTKEEETLATSLGAQVATAICQHAGDMQMRHGFSVGLVAMLQGVWTAMVQVDATALLSSDEPEEPTAERFAETAKNAWIAAKAGGAIDLVKVNVETARNLAAELKPGASLQEAIDALRQQPRTTAPCTCKKCQAKRESVH